MTSKAYADACDRNRAPIFAVIEPLLQNCSAVLEIGSGTGQHAVFFAPRLPHLVWYTSDIKDNHADIRAWIKDSEANNVKGPLLLDVNQEEWPELTIDAVFTANTLHILHWEEVEILFRKVGSLLPEGGMFLVYGPFNYHGNYTSDSNASFDLWLKARNPKSGIRNFQDLEILAGNHSLHFQNDYEMPANNRILHWQKSVQ